MKITSIDIFDFAKCLNYEDCAPICIRINTDSGICGFGEVGLAYGNAHNAGIGMVKDFGQLIIGMDPLNSEAIREKLFRTTFWGMGGGTVINAGMSAIDIALWDIKGKYYKAPVYQLLGGKTNEKLRAYASQIQFDWDLEDRNMVTPEQYAEAAKKAMDQGYTAVKVDPVGVAASGNWQRTRQEADWRLRGQMPKKVLDTVRARLQAIRVQGRRGHRTDGFCNQKYLHGGNPGSGCMLSDCRPDPAVCLSVIQERGRGEQPHSCREKNRCEVKRGTI